MPAILLYTAFPGPWAFGSAILIGVLVLAVASLRDMLRARRGVVAGSGPERVTRG